MSADDDKRLAAEAALQEIGTARMLGLGSGSTAAHFVTALGRKIAADGLAVRGVPTSRETARLAEEAGVPLIDLDEEPVLDLTIDGADEIGPNLMLIKGGGAALLREKIVAAASRRMVVIADGSKQVEMLGRFPLPVEVVDFGVRSTLAGIEAAAAEIGLSGPVAIRQTGTGPVRTDQGNLIADCAFGRITDPPRLAHRLSEIPGVVEHGLFIGLADAAIVAHGGTISHIGRNRREPAA